MIELIITIQAILIIIGIIYLLIIDAKYNKLATKYNELVNSVNQLPELQRIQVLENIRKDIQKDMTNER